MKVFVLTEEPYHDNSIVMGVSISLDAAKVMAARKYPEADWKFDGFYIMNTPNLVAWTKVNHAQIDELFIYAFEV